MTFPPRVLEIMEEVAFSHRVSVKAIRSERRFRPLIAARWEAMARLRSMTFGVGRPSLSQIGIWLNRDHTTVLHALRRYGGAPAKDHHAA